MKLNLVVIKATDLTASVEFYKSLGMMFIEEQHGNGPVHYSCDVDGIIFEIYPGNNENEQRNVRLGFQVEELDELVARLETSGIQIQSHPKESPWGKRAIIVDPDGNRVELMEGEF